VLLGLAARAQAADSPNACAAAYEKAQERRLDGDLLGARERLLECAAPGCAAFIQRDCARWLGEVETALPTVVVLARDVDGHDLTTVTVGSDGVPLAAELDARPITLNPGKHRLTFESAGLSSAPVDVLLVQGQKNRVVEVVLSAPAARAKTSPAAFPRATSVAGALTLAGLLTFGSFAVAGERAESTDRQLPCAVTRTCSDAQLAGARRDYLLADVALTVGVVSAAATAYLWSRHSNRTASARREMSFAAGHSPEAVFATFATSY
jgi:hypothetical protein